MASIPGMCRRALPDSAPPIPTATPLRKSRRVIERCIPISWSLADCRRSSSSSCVMAFVTHFFAEQLFDGAMRLIDGRVGVCRRGGVRIRDRDTPERPASDFMRRLTGRPLRIVERVVLVAVAVRPPVDGDGLDVAGRVEAAGAEHARELI